MSQPSVSIIGSFRKHYDKVREVAGVFVEAGYEVTSPPISQIIDPEQEFVRFVTDPPQLSDQEIQQLTIEKILRSDFVYVMNPAGYIGPATAWELGRVRERGMAVYYAEPPKDLLGGIPEGTVVSAADLLAAIEGGGVHATAVHRPRVAALPTADIVIFTIRSKRLHVLLIKRAKEPFRGRLALPGGFIRPGESLEDTAKRELYEETGLNAARIPLQQVHTYSQPDRDPRGRVLTTAFLAIAPDLPEAHGGTDAARADWIEVEESLWLDPKRLAFDHGEILQLALERTRRLLEHTTVAADFCGKRFTIGNLRVVYEAVWGMPVNAQNFQRKVRNARNFLIPIGVKSSDHPGRPADLFRRGSAQVLNPPMLRPTRRGSRSPDDL